MLEVIYEEDFLRIISKIKDNLIKEQIKKITEDPEIGKPMKYDRKGTREIYVSSFRLSYVYIKEEDKVILLDFYNKDEQ